MNKGFTITQKNCAKVIRRVRKILEKTPIPNKYGKMPITFFECKKCKKKSEVPFEPKSDDVYCEECFKKEIIKRDEKIAEAGLTLPS